LHILEDKIKPILESDELKKEIDNAIVNVILEVLKNIILILVMNISNLMQMNYIVILKIGMKMELRKIIYGQI
jgi:hypothetical protein